jgi:hypothetical protein
MDKEKELSTALGEISEAYERASRQYDENADKWWDSLSYDDKGLAFYSVVKRIYQADVKDRGSYRYTLYDVFGFEPDMYGIGMECGYMTIHNLIYTGIEAGSKSE